MPPGGVIGPLGTTPGATSRGGQAARQVNPVGGVIGQTPGRPPTTAPGTGRASSSGRPGSGARPAVLAGSAGAGARITRVTGLPPQTTRAGTTRQDTTREHPSYDETTHDGLSLAGPPYPVTGGAHRHRANDEQSQEWDPHNPWQTAEGVDPVVLPPQDPGPIDPGPAIGLDR
jgi:hypothetical protein